MKLKYKSLFLSTYIIYGLVFIVISAISSFYINSADVNSVSIEHFKHKFSERDEFITQYFDPVRDVLISTKNNKNFIDFVKTNKNIDVIQNLFATIKGSNGCMDMIRYVDNSGQEIIKVDGGPSHILKEKAQINIADKSRLQNIANQDYTKQFLLLKKDMQNISNIDTTGTNEEKPILRFAISVYDGDTNRGFIVIDMCLREFFKALDNTTLYNIYLIDDLGRFVWYKDLESSIYILKDKPNTIYKHFDKDDVSKILSQDSYMGHNFYSAKVSIDSPQNLKMILDLKFENLSNNELESRIKILMTMIILMILFIPIVIFFAKKPDKLLNDLKIQLQTDHLTKLENRQKLLRDLDKNEDSIVILINIDRFKEINNVYGYHYADNLLIILANKLKSFVENCHTKCHLYKMASDEFAIRYKLDTKERLEKFIDELSDVIQKEPYYCGEECEVFISVTFGISDLNNIKKSEELSQADLALKIAKIDKKLYEIFSQNHILLEKYKQNLIITKQIKKALKDDLVVLHYQPIYDNHTNKIEKYEVLQRIDTLAGLLAPNIYLPIAKANKHYYFLTQKMIEKSFSYFSDKDCEFSINISYDDIIETDFIEYLQVVGTKYNITQKAIIEIVETEEIKDYKLLEQFIKNAKAIGFKIAIDDFGSGYSNFEQILNLSDYIDYIKIDGTLIKDMLQDTKKMIIVNTIIDFCKKLNIKTVAEFVSTKELYEKLVSLGTDYSQGYYIAKPTAQITTKPDFELL